MRPHANDQTNGDVEISPIGEIRAQAAKSAPLPRSGKRRKPFPQELEQVYLRKLVERMRGDSP
jgi:hypothetical protein